MSISERARVTEPIPGFAVVASGEAERDVAHGFVRGWAIGRHNVGARGLHMARGSLEPGTVSAAHYHPDSQSVIYVLSGTALILAGEGLERRQRVHPGDFIYIDSNVIHQVINDGNEPYEFVLVRDTDEETTIEYLPPPTA